MQKHKNFKSFLIIAITIIVLISSLGKCVFNDTAPKDTVSCSYCGKIIRSGGRNIHGTPIYNGNTLKCEYCGHRTNIT